MLYNRGERLFGGGFVADTAHFRLAPGKNPERQSRQSEQEMVMEEIVEIAEEESCDLDLVAGDVPRHCNPACLGQKPSL